MSFFVLVLLQVGTVFVSSWSINGRYPNNLGSAELCLYIYIYLLFYLYKCGINDVMFN